MKGGNEEEMKDGDTKTNERRKMMIVDIISEVKKITSENQTQIEERIKKFDQSNVNQGYLKRHFKWAKLRVPPGYPHKTHSNFLKANSLIYINRELSSSSSDVHIGNQNNNNKEDEKLKQELISDKQIEKLQQNIEESNNHINITDITRSSKYIKFSGIMECQNIEKLEKLSEISWSGIPYHFRPQTWKILLGYLPTNKERREQTIERKRWEYASLIEQYFNGDLSLKDAQELVHFRQIAIDLPRTTQMSSIVQNQSIKSSLHRILFLLSIRRPGIGYVQGFNDLSIPFLHVFLSEYFDNHFDPANERYDNFDISQIDPNDLQKVEADTFWCLSKVIDGIQENYTFAQPGIQKMIFQLQDIIFRKDPQLYKHLLEQEITFMQISFRWMNCLLVREFPLKLVIRIFDSYLAEGEFIGFLVNLCASILLKYSPQLIQMECTDLLLFFQHMPTTKSSLADVEVLLAQSFVLKMNLQNNVDQTQ